MKHVSERNERKKYTYKRTENHSIKRKNTEDEIFVTDKVIFPPSNEKRALKSTKKRERKRRWKRYLKDLVQCHEFKIYDKDNLIEMGIKCTIDLYVYFTLYDIQLKRLRKLCP